MKEVEEKIQVVVKEVEEIILMVVKEVEGIILVVEKEIKEGKEMAKLKVDIILILIAKILQCQKIKLGIIEIL